MAPSRHRHVPNVPMEHIPPQAVPHVPNAQARHPRGLCIVTHREQDTTNAIVRQMPPPRTRIVRAGLFVTPPHRNRRGRHHRLPSQPQSLPRPGHTAYVRHLHPHPRLTPVFVLHVRPEHMHLRTIRWPHVKPVPILILPPVHHRARHVHQPTQTAITRPPQKPNASAHAVPVHIITMAHVC